MKKKMEKRKTPEKRAGNLNFRLRIRAPEGTLLRVTSFPVKTLEKRAVKPQLLIAHAHILPPT
jgi:hypothetical protein